MEGQEITIEDLYNDTATIEVLFEGKKVACSVDMIYYPSFFGNELEPDCRVNNWGANHYFRTKRGADGTKYSSIADLKRGIQNSSIARGYKVQEFILKKK